MVPLFCKNRLGSQVGSTCACNLVLALCREGYLMSIIIERLQSRQFVVCLGVA